MHTPDSMDDPGLSSSPNSEGVQSPPVTPTHSADNEKEIPDKNDFAAIRAVRIYIQPNHAPTFGHQLTVADL
jgi:hypothetical protein